MSSSESRRLFRALEEEVEYLSPETTRIKLFGKLHDIPRRNVGYGDKGVVYKYSGLSLEAKEWTATLREIKSAVESASGHSYNFVLVNRYADGGDCMGEHRDDEEELDPDVPIASLSLGAARDSNDTDAGVPVTLNIGEIFSPFLASFLDAWTRCTDLKFALHLSFSPRQGLLLQARRRSIRKG